MASEPQRFWIHFWFSTYGAWLRGDERGFRDHDHRIHSSGDYKNPPPRGEHAGLREWVEQHMHKQPVALTPSLRARVGGEMLKEFEKQRIEMLALAVGGSHVHGLGRFEQDAAKTIVGYAKRRSSHAIRDAIPGAVWGRRCATKIIRSRAQHIRTFNYIRDHRDEGAWVWTFNEKR